MPAIKVLGLRLFDEAADGLASEMLAFAHAIELGVLWGSVKDENPGIHAGEFRKPHSQLRFGIFARRVERCRIRIPKACYREPCNLHRLPVEIMKAIPAAEARNVRFRLMISRDDIHPIGTLLQNRTELIQAAAPIG